MSPCAHSLALQAFREAAAAICDPVVGRGHLERRLDNGSGMACAPDRR